VKVFISWSGRRSHAVADALSGWLKKVIQSADTWVSSDMERGVKWLAEISDSLDGHSVGVLCVTPGNVGAPWLNFEAGALSKQIGDEVRVIPYLLDFQSAGDLEPPLGQFNASLADEQGTFDMVKTLNAHSEPKLSDADLAETFSMWWPNLRDKLHAIKASGTGQPPARRTTDDKIDELLELTRQLSRQVTAPTWSQLNQVADAIIAARNGGAHGHIELGGGAMRGEGTLSVGQPPPKPLQTSQEIAAEVVGMMLRQAGLDVSAMSVMKVDDRGVWVYVPHLIHDSVPEKVRAALKMTMPGGPRVDFYTSGDTEMKLLNGDVEADARDEQIEKMAAESDREMELKDY